MSELASAMAQVPLWIKVLYTLFVCTVVPIYWVHYGPANFLWFSDIALLTLVAALWLENSLLASMMALAVLVPELAWNIDFLVRLIFRGGTGGMSGYMFDQNRSLLLRGLSLFHIVLPLVLIWLVWRLGYDRRALRWQLVLGWLVLMLTYFLTRPEVNINWVYGWGGQPQQKVPPLVYLGIMMVAFAVLFYLPTHWVLMRLFGRP